MPTSKFYSAVVKGGFWETNGVGNLTPIPGARSYNRRIVAQSLGGSRLLAFKELVEVLNGAAPGVSASKIVPVVRASVELGGVRPIDQVAIIARPSTAADQQEIDQDLLTMTSRTTFGATPPFNGDRNPLGTR